MRGEWAAGSARVVCTRVHVWVALEGCAVSKLPKRAARARVFVCWRATSLPPTELLASFCVLEGYLTAANGTPSAQLACTYASALRMAKRMSGRGELGDRDA